MSDNGVRLHVEASVVSSDGAFLNYSFILRLSSLRVFPSRLFIT